MKDLNAKPETVKLLEENICNMLFDTGLSNFFLDLICQARTESKINKWDNLKLKGFTSTKQKGHLLNVISYI